MRLSDAPWPSFGLPLGIPSTSTTFAFIADSGWVIALQVLIVSPEMPVGVHSDGFVPIVQKSSTRFACLPAAPAPACASPC